MPKRNTRFTYRHPLIPYAAEYDAMDADGGTEEEGDIEAAKERHGILLEIEPKHHATQEITKLIAIKDMSSKLLKMQQLQRAKRKLKVHATAPYVQWKLAPAFHHPEIEAFYRYNLDDTPQANLAAIAALPRATLAQVQALLRQKMKRTT